MGKFEGYLTEGDKKLILETFINVASINYNANTRIGILADIDTVFANEHLKIVGQDPIEQLSNDLIILSKTKYLSTDEIPLLKWLKGVEKKLTTLPEARNFADLRKKAKEIYEKHKADKVIVIPKIVSANHLSPNNLPKLTCELELPQGQVDIASLFYVERSPIELDCYRAVLKSGGLIRIKAPRQMGKTSLLRRILYLVENSEYGQQKYADIVREDVEYVTVSLSFQMASPSVFSDLEYFLKWFCSILTHKLEMENKVDEYWKLPLESKGNCSAYIEDYLLKELERENKVLILGLDEVDLVFDNPNITGHFFSLLRAWNEQSKTGSLFKILRLIIVHSTEVYIPLKLNESPFNVGLPIDLRDFNEDQIDDLAKRHGLDWDSPKTKDLKSMIGGHPFLVRLVLYALASNNDQTLENIMDDAATDAGLFGDHLKQNLRYLEENKNLAVAMKKVVNNTYPVMLDLKEQFELESLGLIALEINKAKPKYELYRLYFQTHLR